jgi:hypothetical protein
LPGPLYRLLAFFGAFFLAFLLLIQPSTLQQTKKVAAASEKRRKTPVSLTSSSCEDRISESTTKLGLGEELTKTKSYSEPKTPRSTRRRRMSPLSAKTSLSISQTTPHKRFLTIHIADKYYWV